MLVEGFGGAPLATAFGFALAAIAGGTAYAVAFTALGAMTSRALVVGLGYTLLWEGVLAGLLEGTRFLSIRQATLGVAAALTGEDVGVDVLGAAVSALIIVVVVVGRVPGHDPDARALPDPLGRLTAGGSASRILATVRGRSTTTVWRRPSSPLRSRLDDWL